MAFWETTGIVFPATQDDPASAVLDSVEASTEALANEFEDNVSLISAVEKAVTKNAFTDLVDSIGDNLREITKFQADVSRAFEDISDSINNSIDILIEQPLTLAFQTLRLVQLPGSIIGSIAARLDAFANLANSLITGEQSVFTETFDSSANNNFQSNNLVASAAVTGQILSSVDNQFLDKSQAIQAAERIVNQFNAVNEWRDLNIESLSLVDTGESYQKLQDAVAIAAGFLVQLSFSLQTEREIIIDRDRTIIDLAAELYGEVDPQLDFLISSNDLSGSEILEIPKGRKIKYYL